MGNPNNNKTKPAIEALQKTIESITSIKTALVPFLKVLKNDNQTSSKKNSNIRSNNEQLSPYKKKEADAAVALAVGTLRYMGQRLKGLDRGRKKDDPLRQELDKIRGMLVSLKALKKLEVELLKKDNTHTDCVEDAPTKSKSNNAKRKVDDNGKEKKKSSPTKKQKR